MGYSFIPNSNDDPRVSQPKLKQNFSKLNTDFAINHIPFTQVVNQGMHTLVQFEDVQVADPDLATPQCSLYTKTVSGASELFFQNGATADDVKQLTNLPIGTTGTNYSVLTPWGIRIQMGQNATGTVTYQTEFQLGFQLLALMTTGVNATRITVTANDKDGFTWTSSTGNTINYLVFGTE